MDDPLRHHREAAAVQDDVMVGTIGCLGILAALTGVAVAAFWNLWTGLTLVALACGAVVRLLRHGRARR